MWSRTMTSCRWRFLLFLASLSLQFFAGISDSSSPKNGTIVDSPTSSSSYSEPKIVIIVLGAVAVGLFSIFLFKLWQKKKREEQYARLLKLFEEDDELEVELGLRE